MESSLVFCGEVLRKNLADGKDERVLWLAEFVTAQTCEGNLWGARVLVARTFDYLGSALGLGL
jgi:hypothetical protein